MKTIVLLGTGNVAHHLFDAFSTINEVKILQVIGRNPEALTYFKKKTTTSTDFTKILDADVYFIAVSDDAIPQVVTFLSHKKGLVVHTSGSASLNSFGNRTHCGVFYPLQSFTKGKIIDFKTVPICIEANLKEDLAVLRYVAQLLSLEVHEISTEQRKSLHLAAVFANNFTNHLFTIASEICKNHHIPFHILTPLIKETVQKLDYLEAFEAQTGPAKRNDIKTMEVHLNMLKDKNNKDIYSLISKSIKETYE